jgi:hypothetical protein
VLGPAEKTERLLSTSLDRCYEILSWSPSDIDPHRLNVHVQVLRVVFAIGVKAMLDGTLGRAAARKRNSDAALERIEAAIHARTRSGSEDSGSIR